MAATSDTNFGKQKGTSNYMILVPLFDLKFPERTCGRRCRNFKSAALAQCGLRTSEEKITLRHRQRLRGRAGQKLAVGAYLIGFGIDLDVGRSAIVNHALLGDAAARVLHGNQFLLDAELPAEPGPHRRLRGEYDRACRSRSPESAEHRPIVHRLRRRD